MGKLTVKEIAFLVFVICTTATPVQARGGSHGGGHGIGHTLGTYNFHSSSGIHSYTPRAHRTRPMIYGYYKVHGAGKNKTIR